jgi:dolichyl-phosphate beta-glucosyltransferase
MGEWEVLFVCDGCTDGTPDRLKEFARSCPGPVQVLSYARNRGKGHAVRRGLESAQGQWLLFTDVDLAYSFDDVERVARVLRAGTDVVIASRVHPDSRLVVAPGLEGYLFRRHLQSRVFSRLVHLMLPLNLGDTQAGLKGLNARAVRLLLPRLRCDGFGFDCELLTASVRLGLTITEVPVYVQLESTASTTSLRTMGRILRELWTIRKAWRPDSLPAPAAELSPEQLENRAA